MQTERIPSETHAIESIERAAAAAREQVASESTPVLTRAELETGKTLAMADILKCSSFYDHATIDGVRGYHAAQSDAVAGLTRRALDRAASFLAAATAIFLRTVQGVYTPAVVRAARHAALEHRPAYDAAEAGMNAAGAVLSRAVDQVPREPTVPRASV